MKVELELSIEEEDESAVMDKISEVTRFAKQQGFKVDEVELERDDEEEDEEQSKNKAKNKSSKKRKTMKRKRS